MNLFRTVVGIDPSGRRLALSAVRFGLGRPCLAAPPKVCELPGDRETARLAEAERPLADFAARHGLAGCEARVAIPADKVFLARISLPPLREKDIRPALALELDRLFPYPSSSLAFQWRRMGGLPGGGNVRLLVVAVPAEYIGRWEELVSRAGLTLAGAVPSGWALSAACRWAGEASAAKGSGICAVLRGVGGAAECTVMAGGEPFFSAVRACAPEAEAAEAGRLLEEALTDAPFSPAETPVDVLAPAGWRLEGAVHAAGGRYRRREDFEALAAAALADPEGKAESVPVWEALGACGAALGEKGPDLSSPEREGSGRRATARAATGALTVVALLAALSWPAAVAVRAKRDLMRLDAEIAALRPAVTRVEESMSLLSGIEERVSALQSASGKREEPLLVLQQLTERIPQGTWLTGLRVEDRKVEIDGLSPAASEIFPLLSRDGRFRRLEFASPITRQPDNFERFQIRAEFVPAETKEKKP